MSTLQIGLLHIQQVRTSPYPLNNGTIFCCIIGRISWHCYHRLIVETMVQLCSIGENKVFDYCIFIYPASSVQNMSISCFLELDVKVL